MKYNPEEKKWYDDDGNELKEIAHIEVPLGSTPPQVTVNTKGKQETSFGELIFFTLLECGGIWLIWNTIVAPKFGLPSLNYGETLGIYAMVKILK